MLVRRLEALAGGRWGAADLEKRLDIKLQSWRLRLARRAIRKPDDFFLLANDWTHMVQAQNNGTPLLLFTGDMIVSRQTFAGRSFDRPSMEEKIDAARRLSGTEPVKGRVVLEVGANIGTTTVEAVKVFGAEHVLAFEAEPENARMACCNLELNGLSESASVRCAAVSNESGDVGLALSGYNRGDHRVLATGDETMGSKKHVATVTVPSVTLDELAARGEIDPKALGLIWSDTQGHEGQVLAGGHSVLAAGVPLIVEYWPDALERAGGLELFEEAVSEHYSHFADPFTSGGLPEWTPRPIGEIRDHRDRYRRESRETGTGAPVHPGGEGSTDLLFWRQAQ
jgi:FkbM family methyltransferase